MKILLSISIVFLMFIFGCSQKVLVETTRTVVDKVQDNNELYLVLTDRKDNIKVKVPREVWDLIQKKSTVTFKVKNGELKEVIKVNGERMENENK